ncbi:MAG: permease-like cell division protein FtsX [Crocinitomicaceae bacterium]|nr:permease-like cell division protein FtsX [Crocinitomicaceae bacterium]
MQEGLDKYTRRRAQTAYVSTIVGISLVLFMLGIVAMSGLVIRKLQKQVKENYQIDLFFNEEIPEADLKIIEAEVDQLDFSIKAEYVSSEEAWAEIKNEFGENPLDVIDGEIPIEPSIKVTINETYFNIDSIRSIEQQMLAKYPNQITDVNYSEEGLENTNDKLFKTTYFVLFIAVLLLVISIAMINNTIRLALYSKRFLIKTMQLVGATNSFINRPMIVQSIVQGLIASVIGMALLVGLLYLIQVYLLDISKLLNVYLFLKIYIGITLTGILISVVATWFALRKFLRLKLEDLY